MFDRTLWHRELAEQDNAHLSVQLPADAEFTLSLEVDGAPVSAGVLHLGAEGATPGEGALRPLDLLADPDRYDPAGLPRAFGIYVWYVADAETLSPDDIAPETRQVLETLGYL